MKRVLIVDDNHATLEALTHIVKGVAPRSIICAVDNAKEAYGLSFEFMIDLFIVDIILDSGRQDDSSGLDFVFKIRNYDKYRFTPVIIISALEDPKLYTYEKLHCYGYIEKPFQRHLVRQMVSECLLYPSPFPAPKPLFFRKDKIIYSVESADIIYIESRCHILHVHTRKEYLKIPNASLKQVKEKLDGYGFFQCHRSILINQRFIDNIDIANCYIKLKNDLGKVEIGQTYKEKLKSFLET